jgi:2',3'-cyclic-nucleotide 2'-phosphodiesterase (5'-nucleotidase family)
MTRAMQRLTVVGTAAGLALSLCAGCTARPAQPNLVGQDIRLMVMHTADIHSRLFPYSFVPDTFDRGYGLFNGPT